MLGLLGWLGPVRDRAADLQKQHRKFEQKTGSTTSVRTACGRWVSLCLCAPALSARLFVVLRALLVAGAVRLELGRVDAIAPGSLPSLAVRAGHQTVVINSPSAIVR